MSVVQQSVQKSRGTYLCAVQHGMLRVGAGVPVHVEVAGGIVRWAGAGEARVGMGCGTWQRSVVGGEACKVASVHGASWCRTAW